MKKWKQVASVMAAFMATSFVAACAPTDTPKQQATAYLTSAVEQLETVKSLKADVSLSFNEVEKFYAADGETFDEALTETSVADIQMNFVLSEDGEGFAVKGEMELTDEDSTDYNKIVLKNDWLYQHNYTIEEGMTDLEKEEAKQAKWEEQYLGLPSENEVEFAVPEALIEAVLGTKEIQDLKQNTVQKMVEAVATKIENNEIEDGKMIWSKDLAPTVNSVFEFIDGIDETTDTLGGVINEVLATIDAELTVEAIFDEVVRVSKLTLTEAAAELDAWLTEEYETTLQGIFDTVVNSELAGVFFTDVFAMDETTVAEIKAFKIADLLAENGSATVDEIVAMVYAQLTGAQQPELPEGVGFVETMLTDVEGMLGATFAEMEIPLPDFSGVTMKDLTVKGGLLVDTEALKFKGATGGLNVAIENKNEESVSTVTIALDVTVSEISSGTVAISAPAREDIAPVLMVNSAWFKAGSEKLYISYSSAYGAEGELWFYTEDEVPLVRLDFDTAEGEIAEGYNQPFEVVLTGHSIIDSDLTDAQIAAVGAYVAQDATYAVTVQMDGTFTTTIKSLDEIVAWYEAQAE